ncbi:MAG: SUMF1/EgtB/PvdO family nonheme iron enzyme [Planctomycetota bacterium]|nr:SUMF1/EgtB/PvdO family nonheme iron enzyme [Planctomycetota bacterium]
MRGPIAILLTLGFALSSSGMSFAADRYALLVGVKKYGSSSGLRSLEFTESDVEELGKILLTTGFKQRNITTLTQTRGIEDTRFFPSRSNILKELDNLLKITEPADTVLIAFSGHGVKFKDAKPSYFCPMDARIGDRANLLSLDDVFAKLKDEKTCKARQRLLICDACRNDPIADQAKAGDSVTRPTPLKPPGGIAALYSCSEGQKAYEDQTFKSGLFFHYINEGLRGAADFDKDNAVSPLELALYTKREVKQRARAEFQAVQLPESFVNVTEFSIPLPGLFRNSIGMKFALIPGGEFMMGSPESEEKRYTSEHQHRVRITRAFHLGVFEVTQAQYERVMGKNPSSFSSSGGNKDQVTGKDTGEFPVERVSWEDAVEFCRRLSNLPAERAAGNTYRLPTEAEWEYACRAGTTTPFSFGSVLNGKQANCSGNYPYGTDTKGPYLQRTMRVGSFAPNAFGLYDMHGNVWEWCSDWYDSDYYKNSPVSDPKGPGAGQFRVLRGGSWYVDAGFCRSAVRYGFSPDYRFNGLGFRVAAVRVIE